MTLPNAVQDIFAEVLCSMSDLCDSFSFAGLVFGRGIIDIMLEVEVSTAVDLHDADPNLASSCSVWQLRFPPAASQYWSRGQRCTAGCGCCTSVDRHLGQMEGCWAHDGQEHYDHLLLVSRDCSGNQELQPKTTA